MNSKANVVEQYVDPRQMGRKYMNGMVSLWNFIGSTKITY